MKPILRALRSSFLWSLSVALLPPAVSPALAQTTSVWTGAQSTNFRVGNNWSTGSIPNPNVVVQFSGSPSQYQANLLSDNTTTVRGIRFNLASPFTIGGITGSRWLVVTNNAAIVVSQGHHGITGDNLGSGSVAGLKMEGADFSIASGSSLTISTRIGQLAGPSANYSLSGGGTLVLAANNGGSNSFSFDTFTVSGGLLRLDAVNALGNSGNNLTVAGSGAAVHFSESIANNAGVIRIAGTGIGGTGALRALANTTIGVAGSSVLLTANASVGVDNATLTFQSAISGARTLSLAGSGTVRFAADNSYAATSIGSGVTLQVGTGGTTGTLGTGSVANGGTLRFNRSNALTVNNLISGAGDLEKQGGGTLTLGAANTYTGTTRIINGTLALASGGSIANSAGLIVGSGAGFDVTAKTTGSGTFALGDGQFLAGLGTVSGTSGGTFQMGAGSLLSPGSSPGTLTFENVNLALAPDSVTLIEVYGVNPGEFDVVSGSDNNTVTFGGILQIFFANDLLPTSGTTLDIFTNWQAYSGSFASIQQVGPHLSPDVSFNHATGQLTFSGDWALNVPEPSTLALLLFGLAAVLRLRRA